MIRFPSHLREDVTQFALRTVVRGPRVWLAAPDPGHVLPREVPEDVVSCAPRKGELAPHHGHGATGPTPGAVQGSLWGLTAPSPGLQVLKEPEQSPPPPPSTAAPPHRGLSPHIQFTSSVLQGRRPNLDRAPSSASIHDSQPRAGMEP